jgi:uncharacterized SAM-binding protein YcdF (DUF218 family)
MEDEGRSTQESLAAVAPMLMARGAGPVIFVSDPTHMLRTLRIASDLGIDAHGSPAADSPSDATLERRLDATLHELAALAWYGIAGKRAGAGAAGSGRP